MSTIKFGSKFKSEFGQLPPVDRERIIAVLRVFMSEIRGVLQDTDRLTGLVRANCKICSTCAFEPKTDKLAGFPSTSYALLDAIITQNKFFGCHSGHDWKKGELDPEKISVCAGFERVVLFSGRQAVDCALRAQKAISAIVVEVFGRA